MLLLLPLIPSVTTVGKMITVWQIVQRCYNNLDPGFYLLPPCSNRPLPVRKRRERPFLLQRATYVMKRGTSAQIVKVIQRVYILGIGRVLLELRVDLYWFRVIYIYIFFFNKGVVALQTCNRRGFCYLLCLYFMPSPHDGYICTFFSF